MNPITLWRCSVCGMKNTFENDNCHVCGEVNPSGNSRVSPNGNQTGQGNVFHISAPAQFNHYPEPVITYEPETNTAPVVDPYTRFFSRMTYFAGAATAIMAAMIVFFVFCIFAYAFIWGTVKAIG